MNAMQQLLDDFEIVANGKRVTSIEIMWEAYRLSMEYDNDRDFTFWETKRKKSTGIYVSYNTARSHYIYPLDKAAKQTKKNWESVTFEEFCKFGGVKRCRKSKLEKQIAKLQSKERDLLSHLSITTGILDQILEEMKDSIGSGYRSLNARKLTKGIQNIQSLRGSTKEYMEENDINIMKCDTKIF